MFITIVGAGDVGAALLEQRVDGVFFTGSVATGAKIAQEMGSRMVRLQLELGGKDPTYVADDADPKGAAESLADGAMYNTGQSCCSVERIYVHERIHDEFVRHFVAAVAAFRSGDPLADGTYIGPLTRAPQLDVLEAQVADAVAKGAKLAAGGKRIARAGNWFEPTVLTGVDHTMAVMRDESFGPIIGIQKVASDDEALALMNDTRYGLTAGMYTRDEARAAKLLARVNAGSVYWNCCDRVSPRLPWSGHGDSGVGVTLVDLRNPGVHAAARLAPALGLSTRDPASAATPPLALFDLDGTLLAGDTDVLWCEFLIDAGILERETLRRREPKRRRTLPARRDRTSRVRDLLRSDARRPTAPTSGRRSAIASSPRRSRRASATRRSSSSAGIATAATASSSPPRRTASSPSRSRRGSASPT